MEITTTAIEAWNEAIAESDRGLVPYRLTVDDFLRMIDLGVLPETPQVELIDGILVERMTKRRPHSYCVGAFDDVLRKLLPITWHVEIESPVILDENSRPKPDVSVVRGSRSDYRNHDPGSADVGLIVEVSESTYSKDRNTLWRLYAEAGLPTYWIVKLAARQIEIFSQPEGQGELAAYRVCQTFGEDQAVPVVIEGVECGSIPLRDILP